MKKKRASKIESIMNDIKQCNKLSTKAVYSIKKTKNPTQPLPEEPIDANQNNSAAINRMVNELLSLRSEVKELRSENVMLKEVIRNSYFVKMDSINWNVGVNMQP